MWLIVALLIGYGVGGFSQYRPLLLTGGYSTDIAITVNSMQECIIRFPKSYSKYPYVIYAWSERNKANYPVLIMVRQKREATAWELPLTVVSKTGNFLFYNTSRTLCHNNMDKISRMQRNSINEFELEKELIVSLSTASEISTNLTIRVDEQEDFYLEENKQYSVAISPSEPRYFYYKYPERNAENYSSNVILDIHSEDDICLTVSIQNASCPVFDLNHDIAFKGKYQTIDTRGGIIIKKTQYRNGFFVVFVAKGDNFDCSQEKSILPMKDNIHVIEALNRSLVLFTIKPTIYKDDYLHASIWVVAVTSSFYTIILICSWCLLNYESKRSKEKEIPIENYTTNNTDDGIKSPKINTQRNVNGRTGIVDELQIKEKLLLCDLARKGPENHHKKSYNYLWHVLTIAVFYGIPVVQLVFTYQRSVHLTGNHDICYYNFLCAHPLYGFSDFNHIFSNIGYVLAGISFFLIIVCRNRNVNRNQKHNKDTEHLQIGIPNHFGLYYAMSVSLIMEGALSACYHICPNQSNFQFDTSFMYIMITLCIVKLYQNRHPDINATAYATFAALGFAIFASMVGIITGHIALWILFIICYILWCIYISLKVYFVRNVIIGLKNANAEFRAQGFTGITPTKKDRFWIVAWGNFVNICMTIGLSFLLRGDFATYLLTLLLGNAILYTFIYMIMKKINGECITIKASIFGALSLITWCIAVYFFVTYLTDWQVTAAKSRQLNRECVLLGYYDYHDIWHLLSAPALFFSFMLLLCLDDDISSKPRNEIAVF